MVTNIQAPAWRAFCVTNNALEQFTERGTVLPTEAVPECHGEKGVRYEQEADSRRVFVERLPVSGRGGGPGD